MSIVGFHRVLISCAILFCASFGIWSGLSWTREGALLDLILAVVFILGAAALTWYLTHLARFLGREPGT